MKVVLAAWPSLHDVPGLGACAPVFVADALAATLRAVGEDSLLHVGGDDADPRLAALALRLSRDAASLASDRADRTLVAWRRFGVRADRIARASPDGAVAARARGRVRARAVLAAGEGAEAILVARGSDLPSESDALALALDEVGAPGRKVHRVVGDVSLFEGGACGRTSGKGIGLDEAADVLPPDVWRLWLLSKVSHDGCVEMDFRWEDLAADLKVLLAAPSDGGDAQVADATAFVHELRPADALRALWPARRDPAGRALLDALLPQVSSRVAAGDPLLRTTDLFHAQLQIRYREAAETRAAEVPFEEAVALASIE